MTVRPFYVALLLGALLFAPLASAQQLSLCETGASCSVSGAVTPGQSSSVRLVWRGQLIGDRAGDLHSPGGVFYAAGADSSAALGEGGRPLSQPIAVGPDGRTTVTVNETLTVPAEVGRAAAAQGAQALWFERRFFLGEQRVMARQRIELRQRPPLAGSARQGDEPGASGLTIERMALRFDTGTQAEVIGRGDRLRARATLRYRRAGLLQAVWEVATPATTRGEAVFRPLENVRRYLPAARQSTLQSPDLPAEQPGLYRVRLRLTAPALEAQTLVLQYQVGEAGLEASPTVPRLPASGPPASETVNEASRFQWQAVPGTHAYQLELYTRAGLGEAAIPAGDPQPTELAGTPEAGVQLRSGQTQTALSPAVFSHLQPGRAYYWRVVAIDRDGAVSAASALQKIRLAE